MASLMVMMVVVMVMVAEVQSDITIYQNTTDLVIIYNRSMVNRPSLASYSDACDPYPTDITTTTTVSVVATVPTSSSSGSSSTAVGIGVGVGVGVAVVAAITAIGSFLYCRKKREAQPPQQKEGVGDVGQKSIVDRKRMPIPGEMPKDLSMPDELPGIKFQREAMKENVYLEVDDPRYTNIQVCAEAQSAYLCPDPVVAEEKTATVESA
ncbi:uncharacterized protein LOC133359389 [Lethenteron reissneri]|uniref:uncharacterized protein LOC133359389 n=1 Tax=Lethenteron reissneri TaxID=7753 RepID=UPI002AB6FF9B|nr:uncharacterized protein LOC133359389 [Lethenteron reissneri]XP_061433775.1 uncharacterized protein LOC133359389 [Lethenteron reissneri]XP_061433776.1 uncharacterized protein LOC133359389 [Lethenteron reissneri]